MKTMFLPRHANLFYYRPISIRVTYLIMTILIFWAIRQEGPNIHQIQKEVLSASISKTHLLKAPGIQFSQKCINF